MSFDHATMREGFSGPGMDTRQWHSYGTVDDDHGDQHSVRFNDDDGNPLTHGVLVDVTLQPSGISLPCRVASVCAGNGESEYHPFVAGDEVYVMIPEGDERNGGVIVGRMNQMHDVFPTSVAGQDVTTNTFGYHRRRTPFIFETASGYQIRQALSGATLTLDQQGQWFITSGDQMMLSMTPDVLSLQLKDAAAALQLDATKQTAALIAGATSFIVDDSSSIFQSQGTLHLQLSGQGAVGHAISAEQVLVLLQSVVTLLGPFFTTPLTPPQILAIMTGAIPAAAVLPLGTLQPLLAVALAVPPDPTGLVPGVGNASFMF